jgi:ABC-type oligopeptide transport system substrate-binding subunit/class 3 adenylate cyclase
MVQPFDFLSALAAYIPHDRVAYILNPNQALATAGVALIADISGFTPLTEALTQGRNADQGAEELTRALDSVFTPIIAEIHAYRGSVIRFGGDALIVWYGQEPQAQPDAVITRALQSALRMQEALQAHGQVQTPLGPVTLRMKIGMAYGAVKRFNLGSSAHGYEDVVVGQTLDRMSEAEHHAQPDEIVCDTETLAQLNAHNVAVKEWREGFAVLNALAQLIQPQSWPPFAWHGDIEILTAQLAPYVPTQIYQTLQAGRAQVAELKPVVSLFVQFHGLRYDDDAQVGEQLQTYFTTAQEVIARYGGRLNRLITGDKGSLLHVIFGAPRAVEEQEVRAIRCALDLQQTCGQLPFITMQRIGVTTGRVFAGPIGAPTRHDYTTMGDSINLSARLMQNAAAGQILMDAAVREKLGDEFDLAELGQIRVKGKAQPVAVFAALGLRALTGRKQARRTLPLIGRDAELNALRERCAALSKGEGSILLLLGEVGMGKTLLLDNVRAETTTRWVGADCVDYGQTVSGGLFVDVLREVMQLSSNLPPTDASQRVSDFCVELFGTARLDATYAYVARFMGLPLPAQFANRLEGLSGESFRWQLFELIPNIFRALLTRQSLVLALDDVQWADATSLQLIEALLPLTTTLPLCFIIAMRPEYDSKAWALRQHIVKTLPDQTLDLTLTTLDETAATQLLDLYTPNLPERIKTQLIAKGSGNPLFLVETARTLHAQGLLTDDADVDAIAAALPDSVQGLLLAQIDRLSLTARHVLQLASVVGKSFSYPVLNEIMGNAQGRSQGLSLRAQLATLEAQAYIRREQDETYTFRHGLIQQSAYSTLLYENRRAQHRQVAKAVERLFPTQVGEQAGLLGFHYERADDMAQATTYYLQSADHARLLYAHDEAETTYQKVLRMFDATTSETDFASLERRAKTYLKLAQVRSNALDFEGAQEFYERAFELLEQAERARPQKALTPEKVFRMGVLQHGPTTLDPALAQVKDVSEIVTDLFEGLVELDTELNVIPAVARRWHILDEGKRYRFELRPNLKWSDGAPLTAHDFVFAWRRNLAPQTNAGMAYQFYGIQGAEEFHKGQHQNSDSIAIHAPDELTLEITLKTPIGYFPYLLTAPIAYPQPAHKIRQWGDIWSKPELLTGNGPFRIKQWRPNEEIQLEKNPNYRGFAAGNLTHISLRFVMPKLEHFLQDEIDWCRVENQSNLPERYPQESFLVQDLQLFFLGFACHSPPFAQRAVRQAFALCIDQSELVRQVTANVHKPALGGVIPPGMPGHSPEIGLRFAPEAARQLLKQIGIDLGALAPTITLAALPGMATPPFLQASWREHLGAQINLIEDMPINQVVANLSKGAIQLALLGWDARYPDPDSVLRPLFHSASPFNCFGWRHRKFDELVNAAIGLTDQTARMRLYHEADRLLVAEDTAVVPLYYRQSYGLMRAGFRLAEGRNIVRGGAFKLKDIVAT